MNIANLGALARRGVEHYAGSVPDDEIIFQIPGWGAAVLGITTAIFIFHMFMVRRFRPVINRIIH